MKSIHFQRNKSLIRVVNEQKQSYKKRNWDRIFYMCLLGILVLILAYYILIKMLFIRADGHVVIENTHIRLTNDARIIKFYVHEGDSIQKQDTLFSYSLILDPNAASQSVNTNATTIKGDDWKVKEAYGLKKKISLNTIDITENTSLINNYKAEIKRLTNEVILDVLPKTRLDFVQNEIIKLSAQNQKLEKENRELGGLITSFEQTGNIDLTAIDASILSESNVITFSDEALSPPKYFRSPVKAIATRIFIHNYETVLKSEEVMALHQSKPAFIKAYFDQEDLKYFKVGDVFTVEFPDGTKSKGVLKRFYIATYTLPEEFQKRYEPTTRSIAGDIYPMDSMEIYKWKVFHKMSVKISKLKLD